MKILIIDDEVNIVKLLKEIFEEDNHIVEVAYNGQQGIEVFSHFKPDVTFLDVKMPIVDGLEALQKIKKINNDAIVIMISGHSNIAIAVKAMKHGAYDFLEKPLSLPMVRVALFKAQEYYNIQHKVSNLEKELADKYKMIGDSQEMKLLNNMIDKVARTSSKVLIQGESGSGKELVAWAIHHRSSRKRNRFVRFNSAAIPNELVESELFGYEKGAFTGAVSSKSGKIEEANNGTLFLDEIGDMSLTAQAKILRVIQEGEFERVGSNKSIKIDARIIAATHKNLQELVEQGLFREDLFYRLNVIPLQVPSLRDRKSDIPLLIEYFSHIFSEEMKVSQKSFDKDAIAIISNCQFKGNVRELRNFVERLYIVLEENQVTSEMLTKMNIEQKEKIDFWQETTKFSTKKQQFEKKYLKIQLEKHGNNISRTSDALNLQQSNLSRKLKDLKIKI